MTNPACGACHSALQGCLALLRAKPIQAILSHLMTVGALMATWTGRPLENPLRNWFKGKRGLEHNASKPIITHAGIFGSCNLAAGYYGVARVTMWTKANRGSAGYRDDYKWL